MVLSIVIACGSPPVGEPPDGPATHALPAVQVAVGGTFACALDHRGGVTCAGDDRWGQASPPADLPPLSELAATAGGLVCGLTRDAGEAVCWGLKEGQAPPAGRLHGLALRAGVACALNDDDRAVCWGETRTRILATPDRPAVEVSPGDGWACIRDPAGTPHCWGAGEPKGAPSGPFHRVVLGAWVACGLDDGWRAQCWGEPRLHRPEPGPYKKIALEALGGCGIDADDQVVCWRNGRAGWAPKGPFADVDVGLSGYACGIRATGEVVCWEPGAVPVPTHPGAEGPPIVPLAELGPWPREDDPLSEWGTGSPQIASIDPEVSCPDVRTWLAAWLAEAQACTRDDECGTAMPSTSCGCTRNLVVRTDADMAAYRSLTELGCGGVGGTSPCDCPPADGFRCFGGRCAWNYTR